MSNPGDRWRPSWMVGAVVVVALLAIVLGFCASDDAAESPSTTASVPAPTR